MGRLSDITAGEEVLVKQGADQEGYQIVGQSQCSRLERGPSSHISCYNMLTLLLKALRQTPKTEKKKKQQ